MMTIGVASADTCSNTTAWINGTLLDVDNSSAIPGVYVRNASNATTGSGDIDSRKFADDTTGTDGFFNISCFQTGAAETIYFNKSGYIERSLTIAAVNATSDHGNLLMTPQTPTLSGAAASSITRNTATYSWTVTATDNVSNNAVGNRIVYKASGIVNQTGSWSNSTTAPSVSLSSLRDGQTYTVYYETYNAAAAGYRAMASTTFTTKKSNMGAIIEAETAGAVPTTKKPAGVLERVLSPNKTPQQRNIIIVVIVVIIGVIAYFGYFANSGGKGKKH